VLPCVPSGRVKVWALVIMEEGFTENLPVVDAKLEGPGTEGT
jgi:hypothetical protein